MLARLAPTIMPALLWTLAACEPADRTALAEEPAPLVELANGQPGPIAIAVFEGEVYWGNAGSAASGGPAIFRVSRDGGAPVLFTDHTDAPTALAIGAAGVAWTTHGPTGTGALLHADLEGQAVFALANTSPTGGVAMLAGNVLWTDPARGMIHAMTLEGGSQRVVAADQDEPGALALDGEDLFWATRTGVLHTSSSAPRSTSKIWSGPRPFQLVLSADTLAWSTEDGGIYAAPRADLAPTELLSIDTALAPSIAIDGAQLFFTDWSTGEIKVLDLCDRSVAIVASEQDQPTALTIDEDFVFWANYGSGTIMRAPKPEAEDLVTGDCAWLD